MGNFVGIGTRVGSEYGSARGTGKSIQKSISGGGGGGGTSGGQIGEAATSGGGATTGGTATRTDGASPQIGEAYTPDMRGPEPGNQYQGSLSTPQSQRTEVDATADGTWLETEASEFHYLAGFGGVDDAPWHYLDLSGPNAVWHELTYGELAKIGQSPMASFPVLCKDVVNDPITVVTVERDSSSGTHAEPGRTNLEEYYTFSATGETQYPPELIGQGYGATGGVVPDWDGWDWTDALETNTYDNARLNKFFLLMGAESAALLDTSFENLRTGVQGALSFEAYSKLQEEFPSVFGNLPAVDLADVAAGAEYEMNWAAAQNYYCKCSWAKGGQWTGSTLCGPSLVSQFQAMMGSLGYTAEEVYYLGLARCHDAGVTPSEAGVFALAQSGMASMDHNVQLQQSMRTPQQQSILGSLGAAAGSGVTVDTPAGTKELAGVYVAGFAPGADTSEAIGNYVGTTFNNAIGSRQYRQFAVLATSEQLAASDYRDYLIDPQQIAYNKNTQGIVLDGLASSYSAGNLPLKYSTNKLKRNLPIKLSKYISTRMHDTNEKVQETVTVITYTNQAPVNTITLAEDRRTITPSLVSPAAAGLSPGALSDMGGAGPISLPTPAAGGTVSATGLPGSGPATVLGGGMFGRGEGY